jgi:hypothetical protein
MVETNQTSELKEGRYGLNLVSMACGGVGGGWRSVDQRRRQLRLEALFRLKDGERGRGMGGPAWAKRPS